MGGCRCTYKNCTIRSDGVTHMFHYPVFDKVRCHQWLTNGQKLEFLNLKVSQLKNRVVCQHHFKDDNFMNFLKDKLTFDAVPTLDGPYCDTSQLPDNRTLQDDSKLYSITLEDIENEYLTFNDKKANFSVKYGDFLTNCDLMDLDAADNTNSKQTTVENILEVPIIFNERVNRKKAVTINQSLLNDLDTSETKNKNFVTIQMSEVPNVNQIPSLLIPSGGSKNRSVFTIQMTEVPVVQNEEIKPNLSTPCVDTQSKNVFTLQMSDELKMPNEHEDIQTNLTMPNIKVWSVPTESQTSNQLKDILEKPKNRKSLIKNNKITILEEQCLSEQLPISLPIPIKLETICPSDVLPLPNKVKHLHQIPDKTVTKPLECNTVKTINTSNVAKEDENNTSKYHGIADKKDSQITLSEVGRQEKNMEDTAPRIISNSNKTNVKKFSLLIKNKIPPERVAAIKEKRKFNMKLRDIIADCVDKMDDNENKIYVNDKSKSELANISQNVSAYRAKDSQLPNVQDYAIAYLDARIKRMENILLKKIDQNTQRIVELKNSVAPSSSRRTTYTQTEVNVEEQKKHLYQQISQYLSTEEIGRAHV